MSNLPALVIYETDDGVSLYSVPDEGDRHEKLRFIDGYYVNVSEPDEDEVNALVDAATEIEAYLQGDSKQNIPAQTPLVDGFDGGAADIDLTQFSFIVKTGWF